MLINGQLVVEREGLLEEIMWITRLRVQCVFLRYFSFEHYLIAKLSLGLLDEQILNQISFK